MFLNKLKQLRFVYSTPSPSSLSYLWNFGSLLGLNLMIQISSGIFLTFHYSSSLQGSFSSVVSIEEEVNFGWMLRSVHANGASFFFILVYLHIARGVACGSYMMSGVWVSGVLILLMLMGTSFLGYVLPWGQMSFWGATVITNLLSAIPYLGEEAVKWVWGGFSVSEPTLERFFSLHFLLPFIILSLAGIHILLLHSSGSSTPLGVDSNSDKIYFHPLFVVKDVLGVLGFVLVFLFVSVGKGDLFMDPDNFSLANPLSTPPHIQPEWYFLFAYAILRSVPSKLGGVIALISSVLILLFLLISEESSRFSFSKKLSFWLQISVVVMLTWLGAMPVESPYVLVSQFLSFIFFMNFIYFGSK